MRLGLPGPLSVSFCGEVDFRMCLGAGLWTPTGHRAAISALCLRLLFKWPLLAWESSGDALEQTPTRTLRDKSISQVCR